jgi:hypothetical protein
VSFGVVKYVGGCRVDFAGWFVYAEARTTSAARIVFLWPGLDFIPTPIAAEEFSNLILGLPSIICP